MHEVAPCPLHLPACLPATASCPPPMPTDQEPCASYTFCIYIWVCLITGFYELRSHVSVLFAFICAQKQRIHFFCRQMLIYSELCGARDRLIVNSDASSARDGSKYHFLNSEHRPRPQGLHTFARFFVIILTLNITRLSSQDS